MTLWVTWDFPSTMMMLLLRFWSTRGGKFLCHSIQESVSHVPCPLASCSWAWRTEDSLGYHPSGAIYLVLFFRAGLELSRPKLARYQVLRDHPVSASPVLRLQVCTATLGLPAEPSPQVGLIIHFNICEVLSGRVWFLVYLTRREYRKMPFSSSTYILSPHLPFPL